MNRKRYNKRYHKKQIIVHRIIFLSICVIILGTIIKLYTSSLFNNVNLATSPPEEPTESSNIDSSPKNSTANHEETDIMLNSNLTYEGEKFSVNAEDVQKILTQNIDDNKYVFLTFDDGPSPNTEKILNILKEKNVKATFFVVGQELEKYDHSKDILKRCISQGNAIGNHTYTHEPKNIYPNNSVDPSIYIDEFNKTNTILKSILGDNFDSRVTRMPGGYCSRKYYHDKNLSAFDEMLKSNQIVNIDWTSLNRDSENKNYSVDELLANAENTSKGLKQIIILMHDTNAKDKTVQMLPALIDYYKNNGYEFKTIKSSKN